MKAIVLKEPGQINSNPLHLVDVPKPEPGPGEVLIKVKACGVCHTDLHIVEGEIPHLFFYHAVPTSISTSCATLSGLTSHFV